MFTSCHTMITVGHHFSPLSHISRKMSIMHQRFVETWAHFLLSIIMFAVKIMWVKERLQNTDNGAHFVSSERHSNGKWQKKKQITYQQGT